MPKASPRKQVGLEYRVFQRDQVVEIADAIGRSEVTVERRLRLIREAWLQLDPDEKSE